MVRLRWLLSRRYYINIWWQVNFMTHHFLKCYCIKYNLCIFPTFSRSMHTLRKIIKEWERDIEEKNIISWVSYSLKDETTFTTIRLSLLEALVELLLTFPNFLCVVELSSFKWFGFGCFGAVYVREELPFTGDPSRPKTDANLDLSNNQNKEHNSQNLRRPQRHCNDIKSKFLKMQRFDVLECGAKFAKIN